MPSPIQAQVYTAAQLLAASSVRMSDFQRPYAWQVEHVARLMDDIVRAMSDNGEGWLACGTITATRDGDGTLRLADGQQRLTTITIALAIARDLETDEARKSTLDDLIRVRDESGTTVRYRLNPQGVTSAFLARAVQEQGATTRHRGDLDDGPSSEAETNIIDNRDWLLRRLSAMDAEERWRLAQFMAHACHFVAILLDSERAARQMFVATTDTGKRPSWLDLFKAELLDQMPVGEIEPCRQIWEVIQHQLGEADMSSLLRHLAFIGNRQTPGDDLKTALSDRIVALEGPHRFVRDELQPKGELYARLRSNRVGTDAVDRRLQYLSWLHHNDGWLAPALHWLSQPSLNVEASARFFARLERLAYVQQLLSIDVRPREARSRALLDAIDRGTALAPGSPLDLSRAEIADLRKALADEGLGNRRLRVALLLRLNGALEGDETPRDTPIASAEHILPSRPAAGSGWFRVFGQAQRMKRRRNMLGNLTLLTPAENVAVANADFEQKRIVYAASPFMLSRAVADQDTWTADHIGTRTDQLINILFGSWQIAR